MTAERAAVTGEPWNEAAAHDVQDATEASQNAPGVTIQKAIPLDWGSRITLADAPTALAGGNALAAAAPSMTLAHQAALYGGSVRATQPESESLAHRAAGTTLAAAISGLTGKGLDMATTGVRAASATNPSEVIQDLQGARSAANQSPIGPSYATAGQQGASYLNTYAPSPELQAAFAHPEIQPYVNAVQNSELGKTMNPAQVGEEVYRLMSELQGKKLTLGENGGATPAADFQLRNVGALKTILKNALGTVEPDFPEAVATHAEMSQPIGATRQGYATANQLLRGTTAAKNLGNAVKDPAAFLAQTVPTMTPDLAEQTLGGVLGRTQQNLGLSVNPLSGFGIGRSAMAINRVSPLVDALDARSGNTLLAAVRRMELAQSGALPDAGQP